jgi:hypothetical protein
MPLMVTTFLEIVMKMRFFLITALLFSSFATGAYAAKHDVNATHKAVTKHVIKAVRKTAVAKRTHKQPTIKITRRPIVKPFVKVIPNPMVKPVANEIVQFDFSKDDLKELSKNHDDQGHVFLQIGKKDKDDEHHYDGHGNGHDNQVNAVPVPAALWLFGSALLGLVGVKRKSA